MSEYFYIKYSDTNVADFNPVSRISCAVRIITNNQTPEFGIKRRISPGDYLIRSGTIAFDVFFCRQIIYFQQIILVNINIGFDMA